MRINRKKYAELTDEQKKKNKARSYLHVYIKRGKIQRKPCFCGDTNSQAHHEDYSKPLEVVWFCRKHHIELHKKKFKI